MKIVQEIKDQGLSSTRQKLTNDEIDLTSVSALELARKARMAANRTYLAEISGGKKDRNIANSTDVKEKLMLVAARELASHVAKSTCAAAIEKANLMYQKASFTLARDEIKLQKELQKLRDAHDTAKNNLEAAKEAAILVEKELSSE